MTGEQTISHVTEADFDREVVESSRQRPVLVDFWADWCQPCKMLAPLLEQLVDEFPGQLGIVKVNTDEQPQLAARFGIRSLPTLMLFRDGGPVDELYGVQPLASLKALVEPHLSRASDRELQRAEDLAEHGDIEQAITLLTQAAGSEPDNYRLHPPLIKLLIDAGRTEEADSWFRALPANVQQEAALIKLEARLGFARAVHGAGDRQELSRRLDADPGDLEARYVLASHQVLEGDYEEAMDQLLEIIRRDKNWKDEAGRKALINVFRLLDNQGPLVKEYRGKLAAALN